jgi:hypothetical protein
VGSASTSAVSSHQIDTLKGTITAKLTVTDRVGQTSSTTASYFVGEIAKYGYYWNTRISYPGNYVLLDFTQVGTNLSGWYWGIPDGVRTTQRRLTGTLTDQRTVSIRTEDGTVELGGTVEWRTDRDPLRQDQFNVTLRLTIQGGLGSGNTYEFLSDYYSWNQLLASPTGQFPVAASHVRRDSLRGYNGR